MKPQHVLNLPQYDPIVGTNVKSIICRTIAYVRENSKFHSSSGAAIHMATVRILNDTYMTIYMLL